jgi:hypothetical protein
MRPIFEQRIYADGSARTVRVQVQADDYVDSDELWMEIEYLSEYGSSTVFGKTNVTSTGAIEAKTGAGDWSQYLECAIPSHSVGPDGTSLVVIRVYSAYYNTTSKIYIDPLIRAFTGSVLLVPPENGNPQYSGFDVKFPFVAGKVRVDEDYGRVNALTSGTLPLNRVSPNAPTAGTQDLPSISSVLSSDTLEGTAGTYTASGGSGISRGRLVNGQA